MKKLLHVGSGAVHILGQHGFMPGEWEELRLDIEPSVHPDIVGSMVKMPQIEDCSNDAIFSSHNLEHLQSHELPKALKEFLRVLNDDGYLVVAVPDLQQVCKLVAEDKLEDIAYISPAGPIAPVDIIYGWRPGIANGAPFMAHRMGFTKKSLEQALRKAGFSSIHIEQDKSLALLGIAAKSDLSGDKIKGLFEKHWGYAPTTKNIAPEIIEYSTKTIVIGTDLSIGKIKGLEDCANAIHFLPEESLKALAKIQTPNIDLVYVESTPESQLPQPTDFFPAVSRILTENGFLMMRFSPMPPEAARHIIAVCAKNAQFGSFAMVSIPEGMFAAFSKKICDDDQMRGILARYIDSTEQTPAKVNENTKPRSFIHPWHWGPRDLDVFNDLLKMASKQVASVYCSDNLFTINRCNSMLYDAPFMKAWKDNCFEITDQAIIWRRYLLALTAFHAAHLEGDFVEAGTYRGTASKTIIDYLGNDVANKTFWLYDLFEHPEGALNHAMPGHGPELYKSVLKRFQNYPNVKVMKGFIPEVFNQGAPDRICWMHIDLNQAPAEMATLETFFERVVPCGIIILDDYECLAYKNQKEAQDPWLLARGYKTLPLPTGQGMIIKR